MNRGGKGILFLIAIAIPGCAEDKHYGDPIEDPAAAQSALGAVANAQLMTSMASNDAALNAVNAVSANFNLMTGAKYNDGAAARQRVSGRLDAVDEACVVVTPTSITYQGCDWAGASVTGEVTVEGDRVTMSVDVDTVLEDISQSTGVRADVVVNDTEIRGFVDFDLDVSASGTSVSSTFDGDFDIDLVDGCAVGGDLEVHATARGNGTSISVWALAEYGPTCGIAIVR